ncbi:MAG: PHP domain-containing protein [Alphaproteobacteria bacterium]|nr:PHP domain-containing protein [Hyphomonas sp.]MBR9807293.1 PHP domain-containing protein [Alphaproteobacteria bacterium]|tara:strand:+ start:1651 stop:2778 length:1128 start_codon:yes stop_codon:yes gene_type:complete
MKTKLLSAAAMVAVVACGASAHERAVEFPNTKDGRIILAADLHTHSVFSDGEVWPSIRVQEAHKDGLEVLAVTEHLEHQPHKADIPHPDRNRSYQIAEETRERSDYDELIVINGAEVTRGPPHGHINAIFLDDANALLQDDPKDALIAAKAQGAFVFLNHPNWLPHTPDGIARLTDYHKELIAGGLLQGVEVVNGTLDGHSEHALQIALDNNLTVLGTSDIHGLVDWTHEAGHGGHRPMTLVLAKAHTQDAFKDALFNKHTVAWSYDDLLGREDDVRAVVEACLSLEPSAFDGKYTVLPVSLVNACPLSFTLLNTSEATFQNTGDSVHAERNSETPLTVRLNGDEDKVILTFTVLNAQIGFRKPLSVTFEANIPG